MKFAVLLLAACGQDHMSSESMRRPETAAPAPTAPSACVAYAKAQCAAMARCAAATAGCEAALERECGDASEAWLRGCAAWSAAATACPFDRTAGDCKR